MAGHCHTTALELLGSQHRAAGGSCGTQSGAELSCSECQSLCQGLGMEVQLWLASVSDPLWSLDLL